MQLLPALTSSPKVVANEAPAGWHLPYSHHVDGHTIATRDGLLMQVIALRGLLFETADTEEINYLTRRPLQGRDGLLDALREKLSRTSSPFETAAQDLRQLDAAREALMAALDSYEPRLLSVYETEAGLCSEPLEFLSTLYNGESRPILLPTQDIGA